MRMVAEVTEWEGNVPNHIYILNDSMTKMIAYVKQGTKDVFTFSKPMSFDTRGRKFLELKDAFEKNDKNTVEVTGSNGKKYTVSKEDERWSCTCPGFSFRGKCKHVDAQK